MFTNWKTILKCTPSSNWPLNSLRAQSKSQQVKKKINDLILKCIWICKGPSIAQTMLEKILHKVGYLTLPEFKTLLGSWTQFQSARGRKGATLGHHVTFRNATQNHSRSRSSKRGRQRQQALPLSRVILFSWPSSWCFKVISPSNLFPEILVSILSGFTPRGPLSPPFSAGLRWGYRFW